MFMKKLTALVWISITVSAALGQIPPNYVPPAPPTPPNLVGPRPQGEGKKPCPSPACDCHLDNDSAPVYELTESICIDCSYGKKILLATYYRDTGENCFSEECGNLGKLLQKVEIWGEQNEKMIGFKIKQQTKRNITNPEDLCADCPPCPDSVIDCVEDRREQCEIVDDEVEPRDVGEPECRCDGIPA
jgi:hypothetical protein